MPRDSKTCSLLFLSHERITLVESRHAAERGGVGKLSRLPGTLKKCSVLLPSHERITLNESGHQAGRGGVGMISRRPWTPNFVFASSLSRENNPGWVWSRSREGRHGEVVRTHRDSKLCSLLLPSHERITLVTLVESGRAAERRGVEKFSQRPGTPKIVPCFFHLTRE